MRVPRPLVCVITATSLIVLGHAAPNALARNNGQWANSPAHIEDVAVGKLMSSQWCRCQETAALMDLGLVELSATFNNAFTLRDRISELTAGRARS